MSYVKISEVAKRLNITTRSVQRRCAKEGIEKGKGVYLITDKLLDSWLLATPRRDTSRHDATVPDVDKRRVATPNEPKPEPTEPVRQSDGATSYSDWLQPERPVINKPIIKEDKPLIIEEDIEEGNTYELNQDEYEQYIITANTVVHQKERIEDYRDQVRTLEENLKLSNNRIKYLENKNDNQLDKVLTGLNNTLSILSEENHLKFIAASEIKPKE